MRPSRFSNRSIADSGSYCSSLLGIYLQRLVGNHKTKSFCHLVKTMEIWIDG